MRRLKILFIFALLFIGIRSFNALDTEQKVHDYAFLLTSEEEEKLNELAHEFVDEYNMDIVMVTIKNRDLSLSTKEYARNFYDYNKFGIGNTRDGLILVIDMSGDRYFKISTTGEAIRIYDDDRIDSILDDIEDQIDKDYDAYYNFFETFINSSSKYAKMGVPSSNKNLYIDEYGDPHYRKQFPWVGITIFSLIISIIVIVVLYLKNKMVRKATSADVYLIKSTINITNRLDRFLTTHTTSVRINDTSSSSGHVGGSSVSRGSSGISHGGGGRRM